MSIHLMLVVVSLFIMVIITRFLPFLFAKFLQDNPVLSKVEKRLPAYVMLLLVLYEIKPGKIPDYHYALPAFFSLFIMTLIYLKTRQLFISILLSTAIYVSLFAFFQGL